jgi:DNA-binding beta-propeller fold protein YncE
MFQVPAQPARLALPVDGWCFLHGTGGNFYSSVLFDCLAERFLEMGCAVLRVNTRGHDGISNAATAERSLRQGAAYEVVDECRHDVAAWLEWLRQRAGPRIGLLGHSSGAVKALYAIAHEPQLSPARLVAHSPPRLSYEVFCAGAKRAEFLETYVHAEQLVSYGQPAALMDVKVPMPFVITAAGYLEKYGPDERYNFLRFLASVKCPTLDFLPDGSLVVADLEGHRVLKVTRDGQLSVRAGAGTKGHRDGAAGKALFNAPHTVAVKPDGEVLVADTLNHCVRQIANGQVTTIAGAPEAGFAGDGGPAGAARFKEAFHVSTTPTGFLVADLGNRRIRSVENGTIRTVAGNGTKGIPSDGSKAVEAPLIDPRAVAQGRDRNVWILERAGHALRVLDPQGRIRTVAGTGKAGPASDGDALQCTLNGPKFVWGERSGNVLIADTDNHCIRRYTPGTGSLTTVVGTGKRGRGVAGGRPTATALDQPHGVAVDKDGILYVSDSLNRRILKIEP